MTVAEILAIPAPQKFNELQIKSLLISHLLREGFIDRQAVIASEFVIAPTRRVDLAILSDKFIGIEIKSDFDTLKRLEGQLSDYVKLFEHVILVVTEKHLAKALATTADQVEVWLVDQFGLLSIAKSANASCELSREAILKLLTKSEVRRMLGVGGATKLTRQALLELADHVTDITVRDFALDIFRLRFEVTSKRFFHGFKRSNVTESQLVKLSRFAQRRNVVEKHKKQNAKFWDNWAKSADLIFSSED